MYVLMYVCFDEEKLMYLFVFGFMSSYYIAIMASKMNVKENSVLVGMCALLEHLKRQHSIHPDKIKACQDLCVEYASKTHSSQKHTSLSYAHTFHQTHILSIKSKSKPQPLSQPQILFINTLHTTKPSHSSTHTHTHTHTHTDASAHDMHRPLHLFL